MAMSIESVQESHSGIQIEGDLGDVQIIEESSEEESYHDAHIETQNVTALEKIPNGLIRASATPVFGSVQVTNSDNVHFGNNTFFHGPVVIKQVIQAGSGHTNPAYQNTDGDDNDSNEQSHRKTDKSIQKKWQVKTWHKLSCSAIGAVLLASICVIILTMQQKYEKNSNQNDSSGDASSSYFALVMECIQESADIAEVMWLLVLTYVGTMLYLWLLPLVHYNRSNPNCEEYKHADILSDPPQSCDRKKADDLLIAPEHLRIVSRTEWLAQPVDEKMDSLRHPAPWVIITHTATQPCYKQTECVWAVRLMQTFHIESRGWSDIGYNWLVGGDGSAYCGRGWDLIGAHTKGYNKYAIAIAFIGTFNTVAPTQHQVEACEKLIKLGVAKGKIAKDYKLLVHRQLMSTLSPGDEVYNIVKTWPHFYNGTSIASILPSY